MAQTYRATKENRHTHICSVPVCGELVLLQDFMFSAVDIAHKHTLSLPLDSVRVESWNIRFPVCVHSLYSQLHLCSSSVNTRQHCIRVLSACSLRIHQPNSWQTLPPVDPRLPGDNYHGGVKHLLNALGIIGSI